MPDIPPVHHPLKRNPPHRLVHRPQRLLERVALGVEPGKFGRVDVVTALLLGLEDELNLLRRCHADRVPVAPEPGTGRRETDSRRGVYVDSLARGPAAL